MNTKLSHSQISKFLLCGKSYEYHYIHRIRPNVTSAALVFGSALDAALNVVLLEGDLGKAEVVFEENFTNTKVNDEQVYIPTSEQIVYANSDFDSDLLTEDDYMDAKKILEKLHLDGTDNILEAYKKIHDRKTSGGIIADERKFYNYMNWLSSRRKGFLMLAAYKKKVLPKITKVLGVQEYVTLENEDGDKIIGYVDLIAEVKDVGVVILDNKTSAREYAEDSVITSPQLSLYVHALKEKYNTRKAGYIVLRKGIVKNRTKICSKCGYDGSGARHKTCSNIIEGQRCNGEWEETFDFDVMIQFLTDEIPEQTEAIVLENADTVNTAIKNKSFPRNLNTCSNYYGGKCPYFDLCYKNKMTGLIKKEEL